MEAPGLTEEVDMLIREATVADLTTIMRHRRGMFFDMGFRERAALDAMEATSAPFIKTGLEEGSFRAWLGEVKGAVVAGEHGFSTFTLSRSIDVVASQRPLLKPLSDGVALKGLRRSLFMRVMQVVTYTRSLASRRRMRCVFF
jgi:hypothetical protein